VLKVKLNLWSTEILRRLLVSARAFFRFQHLKKLTFRRKQTEEDQLARTYAHGIAIARVYRDISEALIGDHYLGGSFEEWWKKKLTEETRISLLYLALDGANASTGGGVEIHRLQ
jgi:hypothetical protein